MSKRALPISLLIALTIAATASGATPRASTSIVGGHAAQAQAWPSIAFLLAAWDQDGNGRLDAAAGCTGTVVKPRWILSAAHCAYRPDGAPVDAMLSITGVADIKDPIGEAIAADRLVVHPSWDPGLFVGDALLVRLAEPSSRPPMPLARGGGAYHSDANAPNVAGWGNVDEQSLIITDVLQEAFIAIQDEATCAGVAADFDAETQTCAGTYAVAGVCHGDSGGPLTVLDAGGAPHLWGLTSYGPQGIGMPPCDLRVPAIFSLVPAFAGWVDAETAEGQTPPGPAGPLAQPPRPVPMAPAVDRTRPVLSGVRLSRSRFAAAGKGAAIVRRRGARLSFTLSEPAGVRITVLRGSKALSSTAPIAMPAGPTTKRFSGRVRGRALRPGRYRLRIGAVDVAGNAARRATVGFRIVR